MLLLFCVKISLPISFFLCSKLCANNISFVQRMTTLHKQRLHFERTMLSWYEQHQLCTNNIDFVRQTMSCLYKLCQLFCSKNNHFAQAMLSLCMNNVNFVWAKLSLFWTPLSVQKSNIFQHKHTRNYQLCKMKMATQTKRWLLKKALWLFYKPGGFIQHAWTLPNDEVNCLVRIEHILAMSLQVVDIECIACKFDQVS